MQNPFHKPAVCIQSFQRTDHLMCRECCAGCHETLLSKVATETGELLAASLRVIIKSRRVGNREGLMLLTSCSSLLTCGPNWHVRPEVYRCPGCTSRGILAVGPTAAIIRSYQPLMSVLCIRSLQIAHISEHAGFAYWCGFEAQEKSLNLYGSRISQTIDCPHLFCLLLLCSSEETTIFFSISTSHYNTQQMR